MTYRLFSEKDERIARPYTDAFYEAQVAGSVESAIHLLGYLYRFFVPASVVDVGCGRGTWLKVCCDMGTPLAHGYDGSWNSQANMIDQRIVFTPVDLEGELPFRRQYELAICVEAAEHLNPARAAPLVTLLNRLSDVVLFGAAIPGQGGTDHINEQYQSYWGELFAGLGFAIFDMFRPVFWNEERVRFWYRQNAFLYVRRTHPLAGVLRSRGIPELPDTRFMNCVHPSLYEAKLKQLSSPPTTMGVGQHFRDFIPSVVRGLQRRMRR